jgi:hypothetical protein
MVWLYRDLCLKRANGGCGMQRSRKRLKPIALLFMNSSFRDKNFLDVKSERGELCTGPDHLEANFNLEWWVTFL